MGGSFGSRESSGSSRSFIDPTQLGFLQQLWQQGLQLSNQQGNQPGNVAGDISGSLLPGLMGNVGQLTDNPFLNQLQNMSNPNNAMVQQNVDLLGQDLNRQFSNQLLPQIQGSAIASGSLGGGRQGVAEGLAAQGISDAFARGSADIRNNALAQAQQAASTGGNLLGQGIQTAFGAAPGLVNLGLSPFQSAFLPLQNLAGLLGNPAILNRGSQSSSGFQMGFSGTGDT